MDIKEFYVNFRLKVITNGIHNLLKTK